MVSSSLRSWRRRLDDDLDAPIVGSAFGRVVLGDGARRTEALRRDAVAGDAARHEVVADCLRAMLRELLIELSASLRVGVAFDDDLRKWVFLDQRVRYVVQLQLR